MSKIDENRKLNMKKEKTGGRAKGTPNRTTAETKELLQSIVSNELDKMGALLEQLEPNERINAISKLLPYIIPRQNELTAEVTVQPKTVISWGKYNIEV